MDCAGMDTITFRVVKPGIEPDEDEARRRMVFEGGQISGAAVASGNLADEKLLIDRTGGTASLDTREIPSGTSITVEVTLTMNDLDHVVTVTITAEEQDGE